MPAVVHVHVDAHGDCGKVPSRVFGTFIEPIDNSINNGVIAEILVNGSLEAGLWNHAMLEQIFRDQPELVESTNQTGIPIPWQSLDPSTGNRFELHVGHAANSWQSLEVMGVPGELTGIMQRIYLPVPNALTYNVSFYARHLSGPSRVTVSLRTHDAQKTVLTSASVEASAGEWRKYSAQLELKPDQVRRLQQVNFGVNVEGDERVDLDEISLMRADATGTLDPDVIRMADAMHLTEVRLGGNFSSYYHWRDGIGPLDRRVTTQNIAWGIPEYNNFGTDEFLQFANLVHAQPQFNLNEGSGTPTEAADWVRYVRERYHGPLILEIGNELYGHWQVGYPTLDELAARTHAFTEVLRPLSKEATIMVTGGTPNSFNQWNAQLLTLPSNSFDLMTTHFITGTNHVKLQPYTPDFMAQAAYAVPFAVGQLFDRMQAQVDASPEHKDVHFAVTEWLFNSKGEGERNFTNESPSSRNEGGAVMIASTFNTYFRHNAQIKLVDMTGLMEFAGIWKRREQVYGTPAYYVFGLYSTAKDQTVLPVKTDTGTYTVENGTAGFPNVSDVPYIDITATRSPDGQSLTLFCVNRSLNFDQQTQVSVDNFRPGPDATVEQITAASRYVMNDEVEPKRVVPQPSSIHIESGKPLRLTLPHESVTVVHLQAR